MPTKIALFDMDGTLADYPGQMRYDLSELHSPDEIMPGLWDAPQWLENRMDLIKKQTGWWRNLPTLKAGFEILEVARSIGFTIQILTKGPHNTTTAWTEKVEWCHDHLPGVGITITKSGSSNSAMDKAGQYGRVLVDDWTPFMKGWLDCRPRGLGIMPISASNDKAGIELVQSGYNIVRYVGSNLEDVRDSLQWAFDREAGRDT